MEKIFVPIEYIDKCVTVENADTLRVYENKPTINTEYEYTDIYFKSNYLTKQGKIIVENEVICRDTTGDVFFRHDIVSILFLVVIMFFFVIYLPVRLISLFGRWL